MKSLLLSVFLCVLSQNSLAANTSVITVMANVSKCTKLFDGKPDGGLYVDTAKFSVELDTVSGTSMNNLHLVTDDEGGEIRTEVVLTQKGLLVLRGEYLREGKVVAASFIRHTPPAQNGFLSSFAICTEADVGKYNLALYYRVEK